MNFVVKIVGCGLCPRYAVKQGGKTVNAPFFSVVIVNYNYGRFLEEAILSVLNQSCQDFELILVDGGSTDNSMEIIRDFSDRLDGVRFSEEGMTNSEVLKCESSKVLECGTEEVLKCGRGKVCECGMSKMRELATANGENLANENNFRTLEPSNSRTRFLWCSEKDRGQSHAFNKGFAQAKGRFLTWLNADDLLLPGTLSAAKKKLSRNPQAKWMTGNGFRFTPDNKVMECGWGPWCMPNVLQGHHAPIAVFGPTSFFSRDLFQQVGGMDESLHYVMDTDLWVRFMAAGESYLRLNHLCWAFRMHELSKTAEYGSHLLEQAARDKLQGELKMCFERHAYHYSKLKHALQLLWRVVTLSEVKSKVMAARWQGRDMGAFIAANCVES